MTSERGTEKLFQRRSLQWQIVINVVYLCECEISNIVKVKISPVTGLDRPRGFQEVKVPRFRDNGTGWW